MKCFIPQLKISLIKFILITIVNITTAEDLDFTRIQPETFGSNMALSNAWADYDNDGDLDLAVTFKTGDVRLYNNELGDFINVGPTLGLPTNGKERRSIAWGDYNADGYLDLYVGTSRYGNELYRNDKSQGFTEVSRELGVDTPEASTRQVSWLDYDNNGTLDLFVADRIGPNYLFSNDGENFIDVSSNTGLADPRATVGACWFDYNQDGYIDLFLANQGKGKDALYKNVGGKFEDVAAKLNMEGGTRTEYEGGVGCAIGDFNNDGHFDLFVATYGNNKLYRNKGDGTFDEVSGEMGITGSDHMVGASWGDYDNDGLLDLFVAGYEKKNGVRSPHDRLFHNEGNSFREVIFHKTALNGADHGIQWADYDFDGDLDISLTEGYNMAGRHPVVRNNLSESARKKSLQIVVSDNKGVLNKAGSEVRVYGAAGKLLGLRLVPTGDGYNSQSNRPVHFAMPREKVVDVEITFLTRQGRKMQRINNVRISDFQLNPLVVKQK